jgi:AraC-like DNA-binding protein
MLHIRNMESSRCISMVKNELNRLGFLYKSVELGEVELLENISRENFRLIDIELRNAGLELIADRNSLLIEKIKAAIHQLIYLTNDLPKPNYSHYISEKVHVDYNSLSHIFSGDQGVTIEKYIIAQKIERIKELLVYDNSSLSDIAYELQYSSVAHLSNQFKKVTGLTPTFFRQHRKNQPQILKMCESYKSVI